MQEPGAPQTPESKFRNLVKGAGQEKEAVLAGKKSDTKTQRRKSNLTVSKDAFC